MVFEIECQQLQAEGLLKEEEQEDEKNYLHNKRLS